MSTSVSFLETMLTNYIGIPIFIAGTVGNLLNILVFTSLRTFRQSSCVISLTFMSALNIGQLMSGLLPRLLNTLFSINGTESSLFYCKFRPYIFHVCTVSSLSCLCLAAFDQYCATCSYRRLQNRCNNIQLAKRLEIANLITWMLHGIPYLVLFYHNVSPTTNKVTCVSTDFIFAQYRSYVIVLCLLGIVPVSIATVLALMAYYNIQQLPHRTIPLARRELDKQLTRMVLIQVIVNIFTIVPHTIVNTILTIPNLINIGSVQSIRCYACMSDYNGQCGDPFDKTNAGNISTIEISNNDRCLKMKISNNVTRLLLNVDLCPENGNGCKTGSVKGVDVSLCCCNSDLCNGASSMFSQSLVFSLILLTMNTFLYVF
ncbi:hypothetical protein I4U23_004559 [Adineta vaga]|nr:hypothetical protein I4U23_004559 [Adineta vaga]